MAAVALSDASFAEAGRATATVTVSPLVWLSQLQAVPWSATTVAAALPDFGEKLLSSPKFGLKSYMARAEMRVPQGILVAVALGVGEPVGVGETVGEGEAVEGKSVGAGLVLVEGVGSGTHPDSPSETAAATATTSAAERRCESIKVVMV